MKSITLILTMITLFSSLAFALNPEVNFKKGNLDGSDWSTKEMMGKVSVIFYADPDKKNLNNDASEALKEKKYDLSLVQSYAIVNLKATWLPNFAVSKAIKGKQKKYPRTKYVKDYSFYLSKGWDFKTGGNDVFVLDKDGNEVYRKLGKLGPDDIKKLISTIEAQIKK